MNKNKESINNKEILTNLYINSNAKHIHFLKDLSRDCLSFELDNLFTNTFIVFKSIENIYIIIYTNKINSIISYNLIRNQKIIEIRNSHSGKITNIKYCLDKNNKRDLILSASCQDNNIKIWNNKNWDLLLDVKNINTDGLLKSVCFLEDNKQIYIITSNFNYYYSFNIGPIKIFDLNGKKIKEINNSKDVTFFVDSFFDKKLNKNYIVAGNSGNAKSYDYKENKIYFKYCDNDKIYRIYHTILITSKKEIVQFIALSNDNYVRIWNFHSGDLLKLLFIKNDNILSYINVIFFTNKI
jgi:WD40 repeat protein